MGELDQLIARQRAAGTTAARIWAEQVLGASQLIVPLEEGTLAGSGEVSDPIATLGGVEFEISYGTVYAERQHDDLTLTHRDGRQAKYLEEPFKARTPALEAAVGRAIAAVTR